MEFNIKVSDFEKIIRKKILEGKMGHTENIADIPAKDDETPISADPQMSVQLSTEMPPVDDPEYVPVTVSELSRAASVISHEVPDGQIDFFYRMLHRLLDTALDRERGDEKLREAVISVQIDRALQEARDDMTSFAGDREGFEPEEEGIDDTELSIDREPKEDVTAAAIAQAIADAGHTHRDAIHTSTSTMNLDFTDVKSASQNFVSFGHKPRKVALPSEFSMHIVVDAIESDDSIRDMFKKHLGPDARDDQKLAVAIQQVKSELEKIISVRTVVSPELAAEMHANILSDKAFSQGETIEEYEELIDKEIEKFENMQGMHSVRLSGAQDQKQIDVPAEMIVSMLVQAKSATIDGSQKDVFQSDEADFGDEPEVGLTEEELEQLERDRQLKNLKKLDGLAPYFGFKNASGIRQWRRKFAEPKMKALVGDISGFAAYSGYYEAVSDKLSGLLDSLEIAASEMLEKMDAALESEPDDKNLEIIQQGMSRVVEDLQKIQSSRDDSEDEELDADLMLNLEGGRVLRFAFDELFFKKEFSNFAAQMKKHIVKFLVSKNIDDKTASVFAKMFNGETDLVPLNDDSSGAKKLRAGGVNSTLYTQTVAEHTRFSKDFFSAARSKVTGKAIGASLRDKKAMKRLLVNSIDALNEEDEKHLEYLQAKADASKPVSQEASSDQVSESVGIIKQAIYKIMTGEA